MYLFRWTSTKVNVVADEGNGWTEIWAPITGWNRSSYTKLGLSASWTHGLIGQLARASEWNSRIVGWNAPPANSSKGIWFFSAQSFFIQKFRLDVWDNIRKLEELMQFWQDFKFRRLKPFKSITKYYQRHLLYWRSISPK